MDSKIRILIADDHAMVRAGLGMLLASQDDMVVVGQAEDGKQAVLLARELKPDVVLMDVAMPVLNGIDAAFQIGAADLGIKILFLSTHRDQFIIGRAVGVDGFAGYVVKQCTSAELFDALRQVMTGRQYLSPVIHDVLKEKILSGLMSGRPRHRPGNELTYREVEVLQLIAEGMPNKLIADKLGISVKTVEKHRQQLMNKLDAHNIARLTRHAYRRRMVALREPDHDLGDPRRVMLK